MAEALCINTYEAPEDVLSAIESGGRELVSYTKITADVFMVDRAICDYKPASGEQPDQDKVEAAESMLQLLPYIALVTPSNRIYLYSRGKGGGEARLHANTSVGLGGHVDSVPPVDEFTLHEWLVEEAQRELWEEAKVAVGSDSINFTHFIVDRTNSVGRVHLGILGVVYIADSMADTIGSAEAGVIEDDGFVDLRGLRENFAQFSKLENWSQMVVSHLYEQHFGVEQG